MSSDIEDRLAKCFQLALPSVPPTAVRSASIDTVPAWDSLGTVILMSLVEEEFSIALSSEASEAFVSFQHVLDLVKRHDDASTAS